MAHALKHQQRIMDSVLTELDCQRIDAFEQALAAWNEAERKLAEAHLEFARDLADDLRKLTE